MAAIAQSAGPTAGIYRALARRNRAIGVLRYVVPLLGLIVLVALGVQVVLASLARDFQIGRITIERNRLSVETPRYAGLLSDGTSYDIVAARAESALDRTSIIELTDASLTLHRPSGVDINAVAARADLQSQTQQVDVPGVTVITDSTGLRAEIDFLHVDMTAQVAHGGRTRVDYPNGQTLDAETMAYDAVAQRWEFTGVTLVVPEVPKKEPAP